MANLNIDIIEELIFTQKRRKLYIFNSSNIFQMISFIVRKNERKVYQT